MGGRSHCRFLRRLDVSYEGACWKEGEEPLINRWAVSSGSLKYPRNDIGGISFGWDSPCRNGDGCFGVGLGRMSKLPRVSLCGGELMKSLLGDTVLYQNGEEGRQRREMATGEC